MEEISKAMTDGTLKSISEDSRFTIKGKSGRVVFLDDDGRRYKVVETTALGAERQGKHTKARQQRATAKARNNRRK